MTYTKKAAKKNSIQNLYVKTAWMSGDNSLYNWLFYSSPFQPFTTVLITDLNLEGETKQLSDLDLVSENLLGARPGVRRLGHPFGIDMVLPMRGI